MSQPVGLLTGSAPFAGLPTNPAAMLLPAFDGAVFSGIKVVTVETPVSYARLPALIPDMVARHRPRFVMSLGLALGASSAKVEMMSVNAAHFAAPDNEGALPTGGEPIDPAGPAGRAATWHGTAVVDAILAAEVPAVLSFHAGTHLCNLTLFTFLGALAAAGLGSPCGFLHVPYLPEQVAWMMRQPRKDGGTAPLASADAPSMALDTQQKAVAAALGVLARQASASLDHPAFRDHEGAVR